MPKWKIERSWTVGPTPGSDRDDAFAFELSAEGRPNRQITVEYAAPSRTSSAHAMQAVHRHLNDDEPPRRLLVGRNGDARPIE